MRGLAGIAAVAIGLGLIALWATPTRVVADHGEEGVVPTFTVDSKGDEPDTVFDDDQCAVVTPSTSPGPGESPLIPEPRCTLRAAIEAANQHPGMDAIEFNIPESEADEDGFYHIFLGEPLPEIDESLIVFGSSQPGSLVNDDPSSVNSVQRIVIEGESIDSTVFPDADGLRVDAEGVRIQGLHIRGFTGDGIDVTANGAQAEVVGNRIVGNGGHGVVVNASATVGSMAPDDRNLIADNTGSGVAVLGPTAGSGTSSMIRGNLVRGNGALGIDLGADGVTPNDPGDADGGPNGLQNFPVVSSAQASSSELFVQGTLSTSATDAFTIDVHSNDACETVGETEIYVGSVDVETDADGNATFNASFPLPSGVNVGNVVTAVASGPQFVAGPDLQTGTSEISGCVDIAQATQPLPSSTTSGPGNSPPPTPQATPPAAPERVSETVAPGGSVTTDSEGDGATPSDPVETSVRTPNGGTVTIEETSVTEPAPSGYRFLGQQVNITAPPATPEDPLVVTFVLDASLIDDEDPASITVFREGVPLAGCTGAAGTASPDPCLASRTVLADGDLELVALTSAASAWNFGVRADIASATPTPRSIPNTAGEAPADPNAIVLTAVLLVGSSAVLLALTGGRRRNTDDDRLAAPRLT